MTEKHLYEFGEFQLDAQQKILLRDGERIALHPKSFATLLALVESNGAVITKDDLMAQVWPDTFVEESSLTKNISVLRKALSNGHDHSDYIETIPTVGYRFVADIRQVTNGTRQAKIVTEATTDAPLPEILSAASLQETATPVHQPIPTPKPKHRWFVAMVALLLASTVGMIVWWKRLSPHKPENKPVANEFAAICLTNHLAEDSSPAWSPDGKRIAFTSNRDGLTAIFVMNADGNDLRKINNGIHCGYAQWSKDGTKIFFSGNDGTQNGLYSMNADGSNVTRLMETEGDWLFSPDNQKIVFAKPLTKNDENSAEIFVASADGSHPVRLTHNSLYDGDPAWSPDGKRIAFTCIVKGDQPDNPEIYVMDADGSHLTRLTNHPAWDSAPSWSPDGTRIAFTSARNCKPGMYAIFVMNADGNNVLPLTEEASSVGETTWSPNGKKILYRSSLAGNSEIYVINSDPNHTTNLTNNLAEDELPIWSPDGKRLSFLSNRDGKDSLYVMNADGSEQHKIISNVSDVGSWSPDGQQIAFAANWAGTYDLYIANADGSKIKRLTDSPAHENHPVWSPDGTRTAYHVNKDDLIQLYVMNADGSGVQKISNSQEHEWQQAWSPDGKKHAFTRSRNRKVQRDLWLMNADGSNATLLAAAPGQDEFINPSFAPDGQRIIFQRIAMSSHLAELWLINIDGSGLAQLTFGGGGWPAWSPDGKKIAFTSRRRTGNSEIYTMDVN